MSAYEPDSPEGRAQQVCVESLSDIIAFDHRDCRQEHYIPSYRMSLQDVAAGLPAGNAAIFSGWLGVLQSGSQTVLVDIGPAADGGRPQVGCVAVAEGSYQGRPTVCLQHLQEALGLPEMDFCELNFLRIPGILFEGFWLKSKDPKRSCRVSPTFFLEDCVRETVYRMPDFMAAIQPYAVKRLAELDNSPSV